jgi:hypothetical protein
MTEDFLNCCIACGSISNSLRSLESHQPRRASIAESAILRLCAVCSKRLEIEEIELQDGGKLFNVKGLGVGYVFPDKIKE